MSWGMVASAAISTGGKLGAAALSKGKGGGGSGSQFELPEYALDQYYKKSQDQLSDVGSNLIKGKPNDYYKPLGEVGGQMFENMLSKGKRDISTSVTQDFARRNVRGARASNVIAQQVGDFSTDMRFKDMLRALEGRKYMLGTGIDTVAGVRGGALSQTGMLNSFNLSRSKLDLQARKQASDLDQAKGSAWSSIMQNAIGAGSKLIGGYLNRDTDGGVGTGVIEGVDGGGASSGGPGGSYSDIYNSDWGNYNIGN